MGGVCCKDEPVDLDSEVDLSHFTLLRSVGKGAFGKVRVVQHRGSRQLFALKYINKAKCIQMGAVENVISERRLLEKIDYNYIVNLRYAFQDDENLFMVIDLMLGGDLRFHLDRLGPFPEECVRFFAAEIALALHYLHKKNIVHRDLKPDNILLNENGHCHLTDFNVAVRYSEEKLPTSVSGSMAYIAPDIFQKGGYTTSVDWWSLGVVCFELLFGQRPFRGKTTDMLKQAIKHAPVEFPNAPLISSDAKDFVSQLLTRDIHQRLGYQDPGLERFKAHPWVQSLPWSQIESKQAESPFIPDSKRANFDPTHELEEMLLEESPLKVRKKSPKRSVSNADFDSSLDNPCDTVAASPEHRILQERFLTFDYTKPEENEARTKEFHRRRGTARPSSQKKISKIKTASVDMTHQRRHASRPVSADDNGTPVLADSVR